MRVDITLLVVLVALFTSSTATTVSDPEKQMQLAPESVNYLRTGNDGTRFLKKAIKHEIDDSNNEERGKTKEVLNKALSLLNGNHNTAKLFKKTNEQLLKKNIGPDDLTNAVKRLELAGWPKDKIDAFKSVAARYQNFWWNNAKLDPW